MSDGLFNPFIALYEGIASMPSQFFVEYNRLKIAGFTHEEAEKIALALWKAGFPKG